MYTMPMQVRSRFSDDQDREDFQPFIKCLARLGYQVVKTDANNKMFVVMVLRKLNVPAANAMSEGAMKWPPLKACVYKRR